MLLQRDMVHTSTGVTDLSLAIPAGRSARVKSIRYWQDATTDIDIDVSVDRKRIWQFIAPHEWHLLQANFDTAKITIFDVFQAAGLIWPIPIATGQTLTISGMAASTFIEVVYDMYDAGDVLSTEPNGTDSGIYQFFQVVSHNAIVTAAADVELNQSDLDALFPAFPGGDIVPAKRMIHLHALFGCPVTSSSLAATAQHSTRLRLLKDREDILDRGLLGTHFVGNQALLFNDTTYVSDASRLWTNRDDTPPGVIIFDDPMRFDDGDELNCFVTIAETGAGIQDIPAGGVKLGLLLSVHPKV